MQFLFPEILPLLLLIPLLILAYIWTVRRRQRYTVRYASLSLVRQALGRGPQVRRHIPPALFLLGMTALIVSFARPYTVVELPSMEATVVLTMDVSGSMRAQDLKPSRIEAAKSAAHDFVVNQASTTRIGVVSFSGSAALVQAPTTKHEDVLAAIDHLFPQRATAIGSGILASLDAIAEATGQDVPSVRETPLAQSSARGRSTSPTPTPMPKGQYVPAVIVLLSDGQNTTGPAPLDAAAIAASRGVRIYTIGVGTPQGAVISPQGSGGFGGGFGGFRAELDEVTLRKIANMTDGKYYYAATEKDLHEIYQALEKQFVLKPQQVEVTAMTMAGGAMLLVLGGVLALLWFHRLP